MAFKFQLGEARMSGSLIQEGSFQLLDDDGTVRVTMDRDNGSITGSAMSLSDGNLTNVGQIFCDVIEPDASGVGLALVFGGDTTKNKMELSDNLADALNITEAGNSYLKFATTNGSELITVGKNSTFAGTTIANLGTVSAATSVTSTAFVGPIDGIVGGNTPAAATVTTLIATALGGALDCDNQNMTNVDIDSGAIDGCNVTVGSGKTLNVSAGTLTTSAAQNLAIMQGAASNVDIGAYDMRAATVTADSLTSGRVPFASTNGLLIDDSDFTFATDTLTVTKIGAFEAAGAIDFSDEAMTNVNIDSGAIDGAIIGANSVAAGSFAAIVGTTCTLSSTLTANGDVDLGNATSDTITCTGQFDSDMIPSTDSARNLGSSAKRWSTIYVDSIVGADVNFDVEAVASGGTIAAGTDYALVTSGGGTVTLPTAVAGKRLYIKLGNATANVTIAANTSDVLPEVTGSLVLESTGSAVTLVAIDATNWYIQ